DNFCSWPEKAGPKHENRRFASRNDDRRWCGSNTGYGFDRRILSQHRAFISRAICRVCLHFGLTSHPRPRWSSNSGMIKEGHARMRFFKFWSISIAIPFLLAVPGATCAQTAPTATQEPAAIDEQWQKASGKYDAPRSAILKEVDAVSHQGPY